MAAVAAPGGAAEASPLPTPGAGGAGAGPGSRLQQPQEDEEHEVVRVRVKGRNMPKVTAELSCQLYEEILYFYTEYRDGFRHGEMWHPIYFWFYFVFMNSLWIIIPSILIWDAWKHLSACQRLMDANKVKKH